MSKQKKENTNISIHLKKRQIMLVYIKFFNKYFCSYFLKKAISHKKTTKTN